jgi:DHA2 family multidrug resistance protein
VSAETRASGSPPAGYLPRGLLALVTLSLSLGAFMNVLDMTITNVAIPEIAGGLGVSPNDGTWVITSFVVTTAVFVPITGWLARRLGEVRLFVLSTLLFTICSFLCGVAPSFAFLLFFRVLQGCGAGPMIPLSQSLLLNNYPAARRGFALAIASVTTVVAPVIGPILGGWITDHWTWPWIFFINVPVGVFSVVATWLVLRRRETARTKLPVDAIGLALLVLWVAPLQILLDRGTQKGWFGSPSIRTLGLVALVAFLFFLVWEWYDPHPVVDLKLFRRLNFSISTLLVTIGFSTYFGGVVIFPLWLQTQMGYTATWAGLAAAPVGVLAIVFTPLVGRYVYRVDLRAIVTASFLVFSWTSFWLGSFPITVGFDQLLPPRFLMGLGVAGFFVPLLAMALSGVSEAETASAAGVWNFFRTLGASFGTSLSVALWDDRATLHDHRLTAALSPSSVWATQALARLRHVLGSSGAAAAALAHIVLRHAFMMATDDYFWLSGWLFLLSVPLIWVARGPFRPSGAGLVVE